MGMKWFPPLFGLKGLAPGISPNVDIVAIHGIDGDREDTWTADNGILWLRDLLPEKIPHARILTYGYDASQLANDFMHDLASTFVSKLVLFREETNTVDRAIIFVAHSSGGLLLKSALIHSHSCNDHHLRHHRMISQSTHGIAFFGTPHQGSATAELARSLLDIESESPFGLTGNVLQYLERDSEVLQHQLGQYLPISGLFETKFFYESCETNVRGLYKMVVPKTSAVVPGAVNAEAIGINKNHFSMVKFESADDDDFQTVSAALSLMAKSAYQKMLEGDLYKATTKEIVLTPSQQSAFTNLLRANTARFDANSSPGCLPGTRVKLLTTISEWTKDVLVKYRIFWLCGQAGTGKTTISLSVAGDCETKGQLGASFFFSRDHAERNDLRLLFPTLAHQLGLFYKPFQKSLAEVLERDPDLVHMDPMRQFKKLIIEPLKSCDSFPASTVVVIDALDECKDDNPTSRMLSILSDHIHELSGLRFYITSRPQDHIHFGFNQLNYSTKSIFLHEIDSAVVDGDIEHYLRFKFSSQSALYPDLLHPNWPSNGEIASLVKKSGRLFIFAATAINFIFDHVYSDPANQLSTLLEQSSASVPSSSPFAVLDQLYLQVLRQAFPAKTSSDRLSTLRTLLGAIVLLRNPLSPGALEDLLKLQPGAVRTALRRLHSVIVVPQTDGRHIRLIHPSFFDFVTTRCSDADFRIDPLACHKHLTTVSFKQMMGLGRNICSIQDVSKLNSEIEDLADRIEKYIPPAMRYACRHWPFHLRSAQEGALPELLMEFCCGQILYWIEALSLLDYVREGIHHLHGLTKYFNTLSAPGILLEAITDSARLMVDSFELISCASLQLYRSALPLSPPSSFLRKTFHHELNGGMRVLQGGWVQKSSGVTILPGSKGFVTSVNFSPDGAHIVSASGDEVRLWDPATGILLQKLNAEPNSEVRWATFFPDGIQVVAGTSSYTLFIWEVATGACLRTIQLWGVDSKRHLACYTTSPDFTRIIGSMGNNILVWRISDGNILKILRGHTDAVNSIAFSPDYKSIASASADHTIGIWNGTSRARLRTLRGHFSQVYTIAFSPDNKYIVSGSSDNDIRLWDRSSGDCLKVLKGHTLSVLSVAFSADGAHITSGSADRTLRVWNTIGGELLKSIPCSGSVRNAGFSPDDKQHISSIDDVIYISDADQVSNLDEAEELSFIIQFSRDGSYITGKNCSEVTQLVWDGVTGTHLISFESEIPATFSPNSKHLASTPTGRKLCLWDIPSRRALWNTPIDSSYDIHAVIFSLDGSRIVSASDDGSLRIWDVASGNNLFTIGSTPFSAATFSPDGSHIITEHGRRDIPPRVRPTPVLPIDEPSERLRYLLEGEWIFASNGTNKERCVWIPQDWRVSHHWRYSSSHGRVAIGARRGLVLLDLSDIPLNPTIGGPTPHHTPVPAQQWKSYNHPIYLFNLRDHPGFSLTFPASVRFEGKLYPTAAHLLEAHKFLQNSDYPEAAEIIRTNDNLTGMYAVGREFEAHRRPDWGDVFFNKLDDTIYTMMTQHRPVREQLLGSGDGTIIFSAEDPYWGDGGGQRIGRNELGRSLTRVRDRLRIPKAVPAPTITS